MMKEKPLKGDWIRKWSMTHRLHQKPAARPEITAKKKKSPTTRRYYNTIATGYAQLEFELAAKNDRIAALEAEVTRLTEKRKRRAIPNPNKTFMLMAEALAAGDPDAENQDPIEQAIVAEQGGEEDKEGDDDDEDDEDDNEAIAPICRLDLLNWW
jgi:hypothetical protein